MGQQVPHGELGIPGVLPDAHGDGGAVPAHHHPVEGQGDGGPLVLLDPPVVVGLAVGQLLVLIEGVLLQVQPGGVDVGRPDDGPLVQPLPADHRQEEGLAPVVAIDLVPGLELLPPDQGAEAGGLGLGDGVVHALPLDLPGVQEGLVPLAVGLDLLLLPGRQAVVAVLGGEEELLPLLLGQGLFFLIVHGNHPSCKIC